MPHRFEVDAQGAGADAQGINAHAQRYEIEPQRPLTLYGTQNTPISYLSKKSSNAFFTHHHPVVLYLLNAKRRNYNSCRKAPQERRTTRLVESTVSCGSSGKVLSF